ncbi:hypothetical protein [Pseudanabaena sp. PCC 6802]|uniref:hypothetical protein n=1 Tax=Pseudanabaena sp. PCC 6802 TaxID=118173 RepID=UPI0003493DFD|nr:hypothetical protein [Pseudanabaena sp. PCC 6802]
MKKPDIKHAVPADRYSLRHKIAANIRYYLTTSGYKIRKTEDDVWTVFAVDGNREVGFINYLGALKFSICYAPYVSSIDVERVNNCIRQALLHYKIQDYALVELACFSIERVSSSMGRS